MNVEGRVAWTDPTIAVLVDVMVPIVLMLLKVMAPFKTSDENVAAPPAMALVDVIVPTTVSDAI